MIASLRIGKVRTSIVRFAKRMRSAFVISAEFLDIIADICNPRLHAKAWLDVKHSTALVSA